MANPNELKFHSRAKTSIFSKFLPAFGFCFEKICTFVVRFNKKKIKWKRLLEEKRN